MSAPYKLSEQDRLEVVEKFKNGANVHSLSRQYLIDRSSIRLVLHRAGLVTIKGKKPIVYKIPTRNPNGKQLQKLPKDFYLWRDDDKDKPRSYADYAKKKGIDLKKLRNACLRDVEVEYDTKFTDACGRRKWEQKKPAK
jgi:hypothetical protein